MSAYTYLFCDLLTDTLIESYQLTGVTFNIALNGAGDFQGSLAITDPAIQASDFMSATVPGRTAVYIDRDGTLVAGYILWSRDYDSKNMQLQLAGKEFWSYFEHRLVLANSLFSQVDQLTIAKTLVDNAQARPSGNIGVDTSGIGTSGIKRDWNIYAYSHTHVHEPIEEMAGMADGFGFAVDVSYDSSGNRKKQLNIGYPRRGASVSQTGLVFEFPGNIMSYTYNEDASPMANAVYDTGAGEDTAALQAVAIQQSELDAGWPLLEGHNTYSDVTVQATLNGHAAADLATASTPIAIPEITVRADQFPELGSYITGDDVRIVIADKRFPTGLDVYERITGIAVTPNDNSGQAEQVVLTLQEAI